ncbi:hypothetical protein [Chondromyces crocatus]|uniref:Uncharacterized protein n=1 Tax=Chondromyces crocatus TaxID=52 RepID=A0A0K1EHR0_CHOCO|nr:hypothetical protein [Chondromyces crocatus]AKT40217.1 uncharacterized protein CMC5_043700 [Chondromyces crocatus]
MSEDVLWFSSGLPANDAGETDGSGPDGISAEPSRFFLSVDDGHVIGCSEVRGFHDAVTAAENPGISLPARLVLRGLDQSALSWIDAWAEDCERVRRTISIRRLLDDREITMVVTLASYGSGVDPELWIESLTAGPAGGIPALLRSGVHPRALVDAALGLAGHPRLEDDAGWLIQG